MQRIVLPVIGVLYAVTLSVAAIGAVRHLTAETVLGCDLPREGRASATRRLVEDTLRFIRIPTIDSRLGGPDIPGGRLNTYEASDGMMLSEESADCGSPQVARALFQQYLRDFSGTDHETVGREILLDSQGCEVGERVMAQLSAKQLAAPGAIWADAAVIVWRRGSVVQALGGSSLRHVLALEAQLTQEVQQEGRR